MSTQLTTKSLFTQTSVQERFEKLLGKKSQGFITSVLQIVANNSMLKNVDPNTVLTAAATAATLDLPINQNLGFAWIVPYKNEAQFQMGWKGYVQLALRTGQYKSINCTEVYENQFNSFNRLTEELDADFNTLGTGEVVGYVAYFKLVNGYEKTCYWSKDEIIGHAKKYSKAYGKSFSPWSDPVQFHAMAKKTVLKSTISKWGIMSIEMQTAHVADQSVTEHDGVTRYPDNINTIDVEADNVEEEGARIVKFIEKSGTLDELLMLKESIDSSSMTPGIEKEFEKKQQTLTQNYEKK